MFILLKKAFQGQQAGTKIDVPSADDAKTLIDSGIGEEVKGDPLQELAEGALKGAMGRLETAIEQAVANRLKEFADAQTRSRKNGGRMIHGEDGGDNKGHTFGDWLLAVRRRDLKRLEEYGSRYVDWDVSTGDQKAALNTQTGTQGGFTTPAEFLPRLMQLTSEMGVVRPRATVIPMSVKSIQVPALDHATVPAAGDTAFLGGLKANWIFS